MGNGWCVDVSFPLSDKVSEMGLENCGQHVDTKEGKRPNFSEPWTATQGHTAHYQFPRAMPHTSHLIDSRRRVWPLAQGRMDLPAAMITFS